jgi:hypothetical protein
LRLPEQERLYEQRKEPTVAKRNDDDDRDQEYDPAGARGGDTGKAAQITGGEKGDHRRNEPVHSGPTRRGAQGTDSEHGKRSGSDSNAGG